MRTKRASIILGGAVAVVALAMASHAAGSGRTASACKSDQGEAALASYTPALHYYDDDIEDSGNAPDFCAEEFVTNDNRSFTIGIHAHNRDGFVAGDSYGVYLNTDRDAATGGGGVGAEYEIVFSSRNAQLEHWNGTDFDPASAVSVPVRWIPDYGPTLVFARSAIGNPATFNVVFASANGTDTDRAPDTGSWPYKTRPFALKVVLLLVRPARAGKPLTAQASVARSDFDEPLTVGKVGCTARFSGHVLAGKGKFNSAFAVCTWHLPKNTRGKRLVGTVSVAYQGARASRAFSARVR